LFSRERASASSFESPALTSAIQGTFIILLDSIFHNPEKKWLKHNTHWIYDNYKTLIQTPSYINLYFGYTLRTKVLCQKKLRIVHQRVCFFEKVSNTFN
jgi:hypothetical protein